MKNFISIVLSIIITAFLTALVLRFAYIKELRSTRSALDAQAAELLLRKNKEGKLIAEKKAAEVRIKELERSDPRLADQIRRDFDIKLKNLRSYIENSFSSHGEGMAKIIPIDTLRDSMVVQTKFNPFAIIINDGYLDLKADVYNEANTPYRYAYTDTMKFAFHMRQDGFLKRKKLYGSGMLSNPNAVITNSKSILVNEYRDKRFGVGPYVGWGVGPDGTVTTIGISVHYSLIKF